MLRRTVLLVGAALLVAGCGVRNSKPFTASGTAPCLRGHGFTRVTTNPLQVGFIAGFADNGGVRAISPSRNALTIAFEADPSTVASTEQAFREHAPKAVRPHMSDIMQTSRNAVLVWTVTPDPGDLDTAMRCLRP